VNLRRIRSRGERLEPPATHPQQGRASEATCDASAAGASVWSHLRRIRSRGERLKPPATHPQQGRASEATCDASRMVDSFRAALKRKHPTTNNRAGCSIVFEIVSESISWLSAYYATWSSLPGNQGTIPQVGCRGHSAQPLQYDCNAPTAYLE
jgi:hypothetical protein